MYHAKLLVVLLLLHTAGSAVQGQTNSRGFVPQPDVDVYQAVLSIRDSEGDRAATILEWTIRDVGDGRKPKENLAAVRGVFPELQDDTARSFLESNSRTFLVPVGTLSSSLPVPDEHFSLQRASFLSFSRVGFDRTGTQAFLYCEWEGTGSGIGTYYLFSRVPGGSWLLEYRHAGWRSRKTRAVL